jgi:hypothetical protein
MTGNPTTPFPEIPEIPALWIRTSVITALLVIFTSISGIFLPATYAREVPLWTIQAVGQDWTNLLVAFLLLVCTYSVACRSLRGYLVWLGLLLYLIYAFAIYAFALHFQSLFLVYVAILGLSGYTMAGGLLAVDREAVARVLRKNPSLQHAAVLLGTVAALFIFLWLSSIIPDLLAGTVPADVAAMQLLVNPVHVLDLAFLLPGMLSTAFLIRRNDPTGYLMAVPLLVFSITMGLGIVAMNLLSIPAGMPYSVEAIVMVSLIILLSATITYRCLTGGGKA